MSILFKHSCILAYNFLPFFVFVIIRSTAKAVFPIVRKDLLFSLLYPPHNSSAAEHTVMLGNAYGLILFIM